MKHHSHKRRSEEIAEELGAPSHLVRRAYFAALRKFIADARVHDYLHVFVAKHVHRALRNRRPELSHLYRRRVNCAVRNGLIVAALNTALPKNLPVKNCAGGEFSSLSQGVQSKRPTGARR
ncbi:DUF3562 domain-containing protein [Cupriavidus pinatubonensis]|uniref:DUF3562 domain-containing protein n=1 Tax=Cupriavidus pinatubonensis TaxID=248026 RepID=UPI001CC36546